MKIKLLLASALIILVCGYVDRIEAQIPDTTQSLQKALAGWTDVYSGVTVSPQNINRGDNFTVTFSIKEKNGQSLTIAEMTCAILDLNGNHLFDMAVRTNVFISAYGTYTYTASGYTNSGILNTPGTYRAEARGRVGASWFTWSITGAGINPAFFYVTNPIPSTPTGVSAVYQASNSRNYITWNSVSGATQYKVYWSTSPGVSKSSNSLTPTTTTDYGHTGVVAGNTYYYRVTAVNGSGESGLSSEVSAYVTPPIPSTPTGVSAVYQASNSRNYITWNSVSGATQYKVYWSTSPGVSKSSNSLTPTTTTDYGHTGVVAGNTYYYRVTAVNGSGESGLSSEVSAYVTPPIPSTPTGVSAVYQASNSRNYITWNSVSGATQYKVYWSTSPGVSKSSNSLTPTTTTDYGHTGVVAGNTYYYRVTAVNGSGESGLSSEVSAYVTPPIPSTPTGVSAVYQASNSRNYITWNSVSGATQYKVYWSTSPGVSKSSNSLTPTTTTDYGHTGVVAGNTYYYRVTAVNGSGESGLSSEVSAYVTPPIPSTPTGVSAVYQASNSRNYITWNSVSGATQYKVYWSTSPGVSKSSNSLTPTTTTDYGHTGVVAGNTYYYRVTAVNGSGESGLSSEVSAYVTPPIPSTPTGVSAVYQASNSRNYITWNSVSGATQYKVYWSTSPGVSKSSNSLTPTTTTDYGHTGVVAGNTYYYRVTAVNGSGESGLSSEVSAYVTPPIPSTPTGVSAVYQASNSRNYITWNSVSGATQYKVYWSTIPGVSKSSNSLTPTTTTDYGHTGVVAGNTYYYRVTAVNGSGESGLSSEVSAYVTPPIPSTPTGVSAVYQASNSRNYITWNSVSGATQYKVYWSTSPGVSKSSNSLTPTTTTDYGHTGVVAGNTYYYRVTAVNGSGESGLSSEVSAYVTPPIPSTPTGVSAVYQASNSRNYITWNSVSGATQYKVYWSTSPGVSKSSNSLTPTTTTDYGHTGVVAGNTYYYRVTAMNGSGESGLSSEVSAYVAPPIPQVPTLFSPPNWQDLTLGNISFDWSDALNTAKYRIKISKNQDMSGALTDEYVTSSNYSKNGLTPATYYWQVGAYNTDNLVVWTSVWAFVVKTVESADLASISGGVRDATTNHAIHGATVQLKQSGFSKYESSTLLDGTYSISGVVPGVYSLEGSLTGYQSSTYPVTIKNNETLTGKNIVLISASIRPVLLSPTNNQVLTTTTIDFKWEPISQKDYYIVQYSTIDQSFPPHPTQTLTLSTAQNNLTLSFKNIFDNTDIFWHIKAVINGSNGQWSETRTFKINSVNQQTITSIRIDNPNNDNHFTQDSQIEASAHLIGDYIGNVSGYWIIDNSTKIGFNKSIDQNNHLIFLNPLPTNLIGRHKIKVQLLNPSALYSNENAYYVDEQKIGTPSKLRVTITPGFLFANNYDTADIVAEVLDAAGRVITSSSFLINISISGPIEIIGSHSANTLNGKAFFKVRAGMQSGKIANVYVNSSGLESAEGKISLINVPYLATKYSIKDYAKILKDIGYNMDRLDQFLSKNVDIPGGPTAMTIESMKRLELFLKFLSYSWYHQKGEFGDNDDNVLGARQISIDFGEAVGKTFQGAAEVGVRIAVLFAETIFKWIADIVSDQIFEWCNSAARHLSQGVSQKHSAEMMQFYEMMCEPFMKLLGKTKDIDVAYAFGPTYFGTLFEKWYSDDWKPTYMSRTQQSLDKAIVYAEIHKYGDNLEKDRNNINLLISQIRIQTNTLHENLTNRPGYFQRIIDSIKAFWDGGMKDSILVFGKKVLLATGELFGFGKWADSLTTFERAFDYLLDMPLLVDSGVNTAFGVNNVSSFTMMDIDKHKLEKQSLQVDNVSSEYLGEYILRYTTSVEMIMNGLQNTTVLDMGSELQKLKEISPQIDNILYSQNAILGSCNATARNLFDNYSALKDSSLIASWESFAHRRTLESMLTNIPMQGLADSTKLELLQIAEMAKQANFEAFGLIQSCLQELSQQSGSPTLIVKYITVLSQSYPISNVVIGIKNAGGSDIKDVCLKIKVTENDREDHVDSLFISELRLGECISIPYDISEYSHTSNTVMLTALPEANNIFQIPRSILVHNDFISSNNDYQRAPILPEMISLSQNYPNPFNPSTTINFYLTHPAKVSLKIYNILGQEICNLLKNKPFNSGFQSVFWDGKNNAGQFVSSGTFMYSLYIDNIILSKRMLLIK